MLIMKKGLKCPAGATSGSVRGQGQGPGDRSLLQSGLKMLLGLLMSPPSSIAGPHEGRLLMGGGRVFHVLQELREVTCKVPI